MTSDPKALAMVSGWKPMKLRDVCELINGRAYKQPELLEHGRYRVLRVGNFFTNDHWYFSDLELEEKKYCDDGDLLYAWSASFGPRIWSGGKVIFHYHIWKVLPNPKLIDKNFLFMFLLWDKERIKEDQGTGTTMIHVSKGSMEDRDIEIPPLPEQRRIARTLETLFQKSKSAREELAGIPRLIERYKQAVLAAAFRGDLAGEDGSTWPHAILGDLISGIDAGKNVRCEERPPNASERGIVKVSSVTWGEFGLAPKFETTG